MKQAIATVFLALASAAQAGSVLKTVPAALDPKQGYVLVRLGERAPDVWNILTLAAYDPVTEDLRGKGRAKANAVAKGADSMVAIGPKAHIDERDHVRTYLAALTPGRYVIQGGPTTCLCLGSYQFDVTPGRITDLGTIQIGPENGSSPWGRLKPLRSSTDIEERGYTVADAVAVEPAGDGATVPVALASMNRVPAAYLPAAHFGNHSGQLLNRALPMENKP